MEKCNSILFVKIKLFVIKVSSTWTRTPCGPLRWQKHTSKLVLTVGRHFVSSLGCGFLFTSSQERNCCCICCWTVNIVDVIDLFVRSLRCHDHEVK